MTAESPTSMAPGGRRTLGGRRKRKKYIAPTANHHDVLFTSGTTKDTAECKDTVRKLARHVSTASGWKRGPSLGKAMADLAAPVHAEPARPVRKYHLNSDTTKITDDRMSEGEMHEPVKDDVDDSTETDGDKRKIARYEAQADIWADNDAKGYALALPHCPDELEAELRDQEAWAAIEDARSVVDPLVLVRDLQYNQSDRKRSIMATVEADFDLYSCAQHGSQSTDAYYKVFTSTVDTIDANGGQAGLHPAAVYQRHLEVAIAKDLVKSNTDPASLDDAGQIALETKSEKPARESSAGEYLTCLFLLLADDDTFGPRGGGTGK